MSMRWGVDSSHSFDMRTGNEKKRTASNIVNEGDPVVNTAQELYFDPENPCRQGDTEIKIHDADHGLFAIIDGQVKNGSAQVVAELLASRCGGVLEKEIENITRQQSTKQARSHARLTISTAMNEAQLRLVQHFLQEHIPPRGQKDVSITLLREVIQPDGKRYLHIGSVGSTRAYLRRGENLVALQSPTHHGISSEGNAEIRVQSVEVQLGDRLLLLSKEVADHLSYQELKDVMVRGYDAKTIERAIQQRTKVAMQKELTLGASVDIAAIVHEIAERNFKQSETSSTERRLNQTDLRHSEQKVFRLQSEMGILEGRLLEAKEQNKSFEEIYDLEKQLAETRKAHAEEVCTLSLDRLLCVEVDLPKPFFVGERVFVASLGGKGIERVQWRIGGYDEKRRVYLLLDPNGRETKNREVGRFDVELWQVSSDRREHKLLRQGKDAQEGMDRATHDYQEAQKRLEDLEEQKRHRAIGLERFRAHFRALPVKNPGQIEAQVMADRRKQTLLQERESLQSEIHLFEERQKLLDHIRDIEVRLDQLVLEKIPVSVRQQKERSLKLEQGDLVKRKARIDVIFSGRYSTKEIAHRRYQHLQRDLRVIDQELDRL